MLIITLFAFISLFPSLVFLAPSHNSNNEFLHPLLFLPGEGGNKMYVRLDKPSTTHWYCSKHSSDWSLYWLQFSIFLSKYSRNCFLANIPLKFNETTNTTSNQPGVFLRVDKPGNLDGMRYLDEFKAYKYYADMFAHFESIGYRDGLNMMGVPYDWRKSPNEMQDVLDSVKDLTEQMYYANSNQTVYLVSHSLGGLVTKKFLETQSQQWKDKFIAGWVSIATPMYGVQESYILYTSGYNFGLPSWILSPGPLKYAQRTYTASAWLLPNPDFWDNKDPILQTPAKNYTVLDYREYFDEIGYDTGYKVWDLTRKILSYESPGVKMFCLYGTGKKTLSNFIFKHNLPNVDQPDEVLYKDGDGSVSVESAMGCQKFTQKQPIVSQTFSGAEHVDLLSDRRVISYVDKIVFHS